MTIQLNSEQERVIQQAIETGNFTPWTRCWIRRWNSSGSERIVQQL
ncbi:MAG: hypothetical protein M3Y72_14170 [Acidobacteriota bacterium]|nr:hypothetical protein [Acidobacteriota bacterium]MDQ2842155.1 hypothetical protein [Acidobacteriota bacterium]